MKKGEVTVFLSLVFVLLFSFIGSMIESASIQVAKNYKRLDMDKAMFSVFAEYQKTLLEEYDIFALEGSYETGNFSDDNITSRLSYYGDKNANHQVSKMQLLSDFNGIGFKEQVIAYMKNQYGLDIIEGLLEQTDSWEEVGNEREGLENLQETVDSDLQNQLTEAEAELDHESNPLDHISSIKESGLLNTVVPDPEQLSKKQISLEQAPSKRKLKEGYGELPVSTDSKGTIATLYLGEYILQKFASLVEPNEAGGLSYELEYVIGGANNDIKNLEIVAQKLLLMRVAPNYIHLIGDSGKVAQAGTLALTLSSALALPVLTEAVKQALLIAWAFGESVMDLRALFAGKKVPLLKDGGTWNLQLSSLLTLGTKDDNSESSDSEKGLSYNEYLRILLFLNKEETKVMRTLDLIEENMQNQFECSYFKVDQCISQLEIESQHTIKGGITYEFATYYGYR